MFLVLTNGNSVEIDKEDEDLSQFVWTQNSDGYACTGTPTSYLHRVILSRVLDRELGRHDYVDHRDNNPTNNCRSNLRLSTNSQNGANRGIPANNTSGYKGVSWYKALSKWKAQIGVLGNRIHLGYFGTKEEAAEAYANAADTHFGEFKYPD